MRQRNGQKSGAGCDPVKALEPWWGLLVVVAAGQNHKATYMFNKRLSMFRMFRPKWKTYLPNTQLKGHSNSISQLPCTRTHHGLPILSHSNCDHVEGEASGTGPSSPAKDPVVPPTYDLLQPNLLTSQLM